jgi:hypothetical protein
MFSEMLSLAETKQQLMNGIGLVWQKAGNMLMNNNIIRILAQH